MSQKKEEHKKGCKVIRQRYEQKATKRQQRLKERSAINDADNMDAPVHIWLSDLSLFSLILFHSIS